MKYLLNTILFVAFIFSNTVEIIAQPTPGYWQQHVDYTMNIDMDVDTYQYNGTQKLV